MLNLLKVIQHAIHGEESKSWSQWANFLSKFSNLLLVINSGGNILIYGWNDRKFYDVLLKILFKKKQKVYKNLCVVKVINNSFNIN